MFVLGDCPLLLAVSSGVHCRGDMGSLSPPESTDILSMKKMPDNIHVMLKYEVIKTYHHYQMGALVIKQQHWTYALRTKH